MGHTPASPQPPFDPANTADPRYDPRTDPRNDPRWQKEQRKNWERAQLLQANAFRAQSKAARRVQAAHYRAQAEANRQQWRMYWRANRRSSIVGPLLLIAVGFIFLLVRSGRIPFHSFLHWYSHWWPLLLIGIGLLRLLEWAYDRTRTGSGNFPARYNAGGGVVLGVILLIVTGVTASGFERHRGDAEQIFSLSGDDLQQFLGSKHEEDSPAIVRSLAQTGRLSIDNPRGEVTIAGTSDDGMLHLSVHKEIYSNSDDAAASRLQSFSPAFSGPDNNLLLKLPAMDGATADLSLLLPAGIEVNVNANRGEVHVSNFKAPVAVTANNGDVEIAAVTGDVSAHVNHRGRSLTVRSITGMVQAQGNGDEVNLSDINGAVRVNGDFFGGGHLQHITGPVRYDTDRIHFALTRLDGEIDMDEHDSFSASEVTGPLTVQTRSRNITLTRVAGDVHVTNNHGDVDVVAVPPTGSLTVDNHNGAITLTMPQKASFTVSADTSDGDASTDFSGIDQQHGSIRGAVNGGGPVVRLTTSHGDISLRHNTEAALPLPAALPRIGFGSGPALTPNASDASPSDIQQTVAAAHNEAKHATEEARRAREEARKAAKEAIDQANQAARAARDAANGKD